MDLPGDGIVSKATLDWIQPLWEAELAQAVEAREARRCNNLFGNEDGDDENTDEDSDSTDRLLMISKESIPSFLGVADFSFWMDDHSTGHGNRVWHASIATCMYLKEYFHSQMPKSSASSPSSASSWQSLELGAGTALPSLFLGHLIASQREDDGHDHAAARPFLHITDGKQYRNIRQVLYSLSKQPPAIRETATYRVSPHNWGQNLDTFLSQECHAATPRSYDLVIVSDCIYNPTFHRDLLTTIAATLRLPDGPHDSGGRVILSFSLHGNTPDQDIWNFIDGMVPETQHGEWRLQACPVRAESLASTTLAAAPDGRKEQPTEGRHGWDMEQMMKDLGLWVANIKAKRWFSYLYEITWTKD